MKNIIAHFLIVTAPPFARHLLNLFRGEEIAAPQADSHRLFFPHREDALTQLGWALKLYDTSLDYASTPQAKGKLERGHQFWQKRDPRASPPKASPTSLPPMRSLTPCAITTTPTKTPRTGHDAPGRLEASPEGGPFGVLRPQPQRPWWPYVWSVRTRLKIAYDGTVPVGSQRCRLTVAPPSTPVIRCQHPDGRLIVLLHLPKRETKPIRLLGEGLVAHHECRFVCDTATRHPMIISLTGTDMVATKVQSIARTSQASGEECSVFNRVWATRLRRNRPYGINAMFSRPSVLGASGVSDL